MKNITKYLLPAAIIIAALIIAQALSHFIPERVPEGALSSKEAGIKAINYLNQVLLKGQGYALLTDVSEARLYNIHFKVEGDEQDKEYDIYLSKDGKIAYLQGQGIPEAISSSEIWEQLESLKTDTPLARLFVMSFCPYGNQAEELMMPVANLLGDKADIELHYVIYSNYGGGSPDYCLDKEAKYCSMHGIQELNQGVRELCVQKYQKDKFWDFVKEINSNCNYQDVDSCWENIAKKVGLNTQQIKTCQKNEALDLLAKEVELSAKYGIKGSPQLIINGVEYSGTRTSDAYKAGICSAFNSAPTECSQTLSTEGGSASGGCE